MGSKLARGPFRATAPIVHRDAITAVDTGTPAATAYLENHTAAEYARLWIDVSFVGGTTPEIDVTPWYKAHGSTSLYLEGTALQDGGDDGFLAGLHMKEVEVKGMDLFAYLDNVSGSPTSFEVTVTVVWF